LLTLTGHRVEHGGIVGATELVHGVESSALIVKHSAGRWGARIRLPAQTADALGAAADQLPRVAVLSQEPFIAGDLTDSIHLPGLRLLGLRLLGLIRLAGLRQRVTRHQ
jgi:hypothetical protein